jgi:hypothetical protein
MASIGNISMIMGVVMSSINIGVIGRVIGLFGVSISICFGFRFGVRG